MMRKDNKSLVKLAQYLSILILIAAGSFAASAKENVGMPDPGKGNPKQTELGKRAGCAPATDQVDLNINNVRTTILNGGDMWWNLSNAKYEIPKVEPGQISKHSLFSGALWIGGISSGTLKLAAQTYRQNGNDFYPGPLVSGTLSINPETCLKYDRIFQVTSRDIATHVNSDDKVSNVPVDINEWPGNPSGKDPVGIAPKLAPFFDIDSNGVYEAAAGDYPTLNDGVEDLNNIPNMMLFTIYNDKGGIHAETNSVPIGLEFHLQAFAYTTNNEINNMTFYRTTIFNRSNERLDSTVFGQWIDPDLGNYSDDYVECDIPRNLGICYNGDDNDEGILGYGLNPPSVGVTFFEGPRREDSTEIGLTKFVYYNNDFSIIGNPSRPEHYWNYLNGKWKDGASITYGGNGRGGSDTASFMFPGTTDPAGRPAWNERIAGNQPQDRRFLQTVGSFTLKPGAVNRVTIGVVWAKASSGGATGSFNLLKQASDKATTLYRNNFTPKNGPEAPLLEIVELDRKIVIKLTKTQALENFVDSFAGPCGLKTVYKFQGYQIWQLKTPNVPSDVNDQNQARLVAQFDLVDGTARVVNTVFSPELEENVKRIMVDGSNSGIQHSVEITKDFFETGTDQTIVNFKDYHYYAVAYATSTNCPGDFDQYLSSAITTGSDELLRYTATPHDPSPSAYTPNSDYGTGIPVTMVEGKGNGGRVVRLSQTTISKILEAPYYAKDRSYLGAYSPVNVKIIDPLKVPKCDFELGLVDSSSSSRKTDTLTRATTKWFLRNITTGEVSYSETALSSPNEQLFVNWGLSVKVEQSILPGDAESQVDNTNGYISSEIIFGDPTNKWLSGVVDEQYQNYVPFNWIRSGSLGKPDYNLGELHDFAKSVGTTKVPIDPRKNFSSILESKWAPYALAARWKTTTSTGKLPSFGPAWDYPALNGLYNTANLLSDLYSVEVVLTKDKSKWSRCIVLELGEDKALNIGGADKMEVRKSPSVDKDGVADGSGTGFGWFPGYAINLETGERLNILFGEDSSIPQENGSDMVWNPTSTVFNENGRPVFGGKHYIYVASPKVYGSGSSRYVGPRYDGCADYFTRLGLGSTQSKDQVFSQMLYTSMAMVAPGSKMLSPYQNLVPDEVTIRIHVKRPYASFSVDGDVANDSMPLFRFTTDGLHTVINDKAIAKKVLDKVSIVPNPYYAYSQYETPGNQLDSRIKITNLPPKCLVQIYTQDGVVVRTIRKDDPTQTYLLWDLKNNAKAPIGSGVYLIHIKSDDLGEERIIKWFGIMRPVDYDNF